MKRYFFFYLSILIFSGFAFAETTPSRDERENMVAEKTIIGSLFREHSQKIRNRCAQVDKACAISNHAELGLSVIGVKNTHHSLKSLASLVKINMDGALSTDYTCYVLQKGESMLTYFDDLDIDSMMNQCKISVEKFNRYYDEAIRPESLCSDSEKIRRKIAELKEAILNGRVCPPGDF